VARAELRWPVHGEQATGCRRAGKNEKRTRFTDWVLMFLGRIEEHNDPMFLGDLTWPRNIRTHLMFLGLPDLADEHKSLYFS
jgi:hypothetical protein